MSELEVAAMVRLRASVEESDNTTTESKTQNDSALNVLIDVRLGFAESLRLAIERNDICASDRCYAKLQIVMDAVKAQQKKLEKCKKIVKRWKIIIS